MSSTLTFKQKSSPIFLKILFKTIFFLKDHPTLRFFVQALLGNWIFTGVLCTFVEIMYGKVPSDIHPMVYLLLTIHNAFASSVVFCWLIALSKINDVWQVLYYLQVHYIQKTKTLTFFKHSISITTITAFLGMELLIFILCGNMTTFVGLNIALDFYGYFNNLNMKLENLMKAYSNEKMLWVVGRNQGQRSVLRGLLNLAQKHIELTKLLDIYNMLVGTFFALATALSGVQILIIVALVIIKNEININKLTTEYHSDLDDPWKYGLIVFVFTVAMSNIWLLAIISQLVKNQGEKTNKLCHIFLTHFPSNLNPEDHLLRLEIISFIQQNKELSPSIMMANYTYDLKLLLTVASTLASNSIVMIQYLFITQN